ncbi:MAG: hypothetical protein HOP10_03020 [Chitinophagaceae bacterium]|nr:hypothetical protein [Chitinophagaceae bacterium]
MKIQALILSLCILCTGSAYGQWNTSGNDIYNSNSGNVGIGTGIPASKLDVAGSSNFTQKNVFNIRTSIWGTNTSQVTIGYDNDNTTDRGVIDYRGIANGYNGNGAFINVIFLPGNIFSCNYPSTGIMNFEIESPYVYDLNGFVGSGAALRYKLTQTNTVGNVYGTFIDITRTAATGWSTYGHISKIKNFNDVGYGFYADVTNYTGGTGASYAFYAAAGRSYFANEVAIGTTTYPAGYKLAVGGNIIAEKVRVKLQSSGWPDYVFDEKYHLPTLKETEQFIKQNNHLPGVPSAAQIEKEGLDLGDGQAVLLKKIEELTLHLIELDKKVEKLQTENGALKKKNK